MSENLGETNELETERRRDAALRRALAMPPVGKAKRRELARLIEETREVSSEIASLRRQGAPRRRQGAR